MALTIGIVGLPNAGKSTLFNALTKNDVLAANYPFATIEPNVGVVGVPDARLKPLGELMESARLVPATVEFVDIAGIVRGASEGEGLGNKFLSHIRESAAICQVTRVFRDDDVTHVEGEVNPESDLTTIQTELILADLQTLEKAIPRLEKEARGNKSVAANLEAAREAQSALEGGTPVIALGQSGAVHVHLHDIEPVWIEIEQPASNAMIGRVRVRVGNGFKPVSRKQGVGPGRSLARSDLSCVVI